jgi:hypothetical protein
MMERKRGLHGREHLENDATSAQSRVSNDLKTTTSDKRCAVGGKSVGAACVKNLEQVQMPLRESVSDDVSRAAWYLMNRKRLVQEAVEAGREAIEAFKRAEKQR